MAQYIDKTALVSEIERLKNTSLEYGYNTMQKVLADSGKDISLRQLQNFIETLEVKDPYITCIQYTDREAAIKAHAEDYSWNIESELFQQLTPEQQKLWRKEIEQACISGGYSGLNLAKDSRYKENLEVKDVDYNDAFIEKACEFLKSYRQETYDGTGYIAGIVNDETIEDFRKYMRGE